MAKIVNKFLAQAPADTLKGNNTGSTANVTDLTVSQVNAMLGTLTNPMTTGGDLIYGGTSGTPLRLANGSSGQVLTSNGGTSAPSWQTNPSAITNNYYSGYFGGASSWSSSSGTLAPLNNSGGNALTQRQASGMTVTAGASGVCGITFTPQSSTSIYLITCSFGVYGSGNIAFSLTDGTTTLTTGSVQTYDLWETLTGIYAPGTGSSVTVQLFGASSASMNVAQLSAQSNSVEWTIVQIK